jgi:hypothetical protein
MDSNGVLGGGSGRLTGDFAESMYR